MEKTSFYPETTPLLPEHTDAQGDLVSAEEKDSLLNYLLGQGELSLLRGDLSGLELFEKAVELDPANPEIFYRQGLALFEYGSEEGKEKALLLANKKFKAATTLYPTYFEAWHAWGNTLSVLGTKYRAHHYSLETAEKLKKAIATGEGKNPDVLAELFWDYGVVSAKIGKHSGEAIDLQMAIDSFQKSCELQDALPSEFWNDFGLACLQMGDLLSDMRLYTKAVDYFKHAISLSIASFDGWKNLARAFQKIYTQTHDEDHFNQANECFTSASNLTTHDNELWLDWVSLLCDSGRKTQDLKRLKSCLEKCQRSYVANPDQPLLIAIWAEALALIGELSDKLDFIYEAQNKIAEALDLSENENPDIYFSYGMCLNSFGRYFGEIDYYFQAIEQFQEGLSIDRTSHRNWHAIAYTYTIVGEIQGDITAYEKASRFYAKAIDLRPYSLYIFDSAIALLKLGEMKEDQSYLENAVTRFEQALNLQKNVLYIHPDWLFHYATALDMLGDFHDDEAFYLKTIEILSHVLMVDPDFPKIHHRLALAFSHLGELGNEIEHFYRALHHFRLASKNEEENDQIILDWGVTLINIAHNLHDSQESPLFYQEAEHKLTAAAKLGNEQAYYHLGCLYSLLEQYDRSMHFIQKSHTCKSLPPIDEVLEDEWLEGLRSTSLFQHFLSLFGK
ncbi:MAG: tetratricopeptide repeat protein [Rhabdochlamydiaceae bacterium]|jgi:tetratricopeptide (TPR) repeat protein